jgi:hypothetical protein
MVILRFEYSSLFAYILADVIHFHCVLCWDI